MLIPWRTDAPIYHRPWVTGGLIAACLAVHVLMDSPAEAFVLRYGTIQPLQWVTSVFLHSGWLHLLGNLMFLWTFGMLIEGKVGAWRFGAIYLGIAVISCFVEQVLMLGAKGGSLGASGVLFGLVAIALVWAPENEVDCVWTFGPMAQTTEISVRNLALLFGLFQVPGLILAGFHPSSALLHLLGAAVGLPIGILMLKRGWVDCEGWDWFSRRKPARRG